MAKNLVGISLILFLVSSATAVGYLYGRIAPKQRHTFIPVFAIAGLVAGLIDHLLLGREISLVFRPFLYFLWIGITANVVAKKHSS